MMDYKPTPSGTVIADASLANDLDSVYARFEANTISSQHAIA